MPKFLYPCCLSLRCISLQINAQNTDDTLGIKNLIQKEVDALNRDHDLEDYLSCFKLSEKIQVGPSNDKMTIGFEAVKANAMQVIKNYDGIPNPNT